jgi:hypothetical protein
MLHGKFGSWIRGLEMENKKPNSFSVFHLARYLILLPHCEKSAIRAIADNVRKPDGYCNASIPTLAHNNGLSERHLQHGIVGRKRKDGTKYNPGLIERGLIYKDENISFSCGRGNTAVYRVNLENWREYLPAERHAALDLLIENSAQTPHKERTNSAQTPHNSDNDAAVSPLDTSKPRTNPANVRTKPLEENPEARNHNPEQEAAEEDATERFQQMLTEYLDCLPTQVADSDGRKLVEHEKRYGQATAALSFMAFLDNSENLRVGDSERTHLFSYFFKSTQAGHFAKRYEPLVDVGFRDRETIEWLHSAGANGDAEQTFNAREAVYLEEWFKTTSHAEDRYHEFMEETEYQGTLKEFIARLGYTEPIPADLILPEQNQQELTV